MANECKYSPLNKLRMIGFVPDFSYKFFICLAFILLQPLVLPPLLHANVLDWFATGNSNEQDKSQNASVQAIIKIDNTEIKQTSDLNPYVFVQKHWSQSSAALNTICKRISEVSGDANFTDIIEKLFVITTQIYRENLKSSALAVTDIAKANKDVQSQVYTLAKIIKSPGKESLGTLEKNLGNLSEMNYSLSQLIKKYLLSSEYVISLSGNVYETLMLIPSLSNPLLDMLVKSSIQMMRSAKSNAEAFKGLLLNFENSSEVASNGIAAIKQTIKETLRFSNHFAINQFPLINLPAPTRESVFVQLKTFNNNIKAVENTLIVSDSQARNSAQQYSNTIETLVEKSTEALRYTTSFERPLEQILNYTRNQISGLLLRTKEDMQRMKTELEQLKTETSITPNIAYETQKESSVRVTRSAATNKLPLFLLGEKTSTTSKIAAKTSPATSKTNLDKRDIQITSAARSPQLIPPSNSADNFRPLPIKNDDSLPPAISFDTERRDSQMHETLLYSENSNNRDFGLIESELNILQQELGNDFFFGDLAKIESEKQSKSAPPSSTFGERSFNFNSSGQGNLEDLVPLSLTHSNLDFNIDPEIQMLKMQY